MKVIRLSNKPILKNKIKLLINGVASIELIDSIKNMIMMLLSYLKLSLNIIDIIQGKVKYLENR